MKRRSGYILILTLLVSAALFFLAILYTDFFSSEQKLAMHSENDIIAEAAAEAGIDDAIYQLNSDSSWTAGFNQVELPHSRATYSMSFNSGQTAIPYSTNNLQSSVATTGYQGRIVPPQSADLIAVGFYGGNRQLDETMIKIGGTSPFYGAVFVKDNISLDGSHIIDSYDSSLGTYAQTRRNYGGDIGTNSGDDRKIVLKGSSMIYGEVVGGPGATESGSVVTRGSIVYQGFTNGPERSFPYINPPLGTNQGSVSYNGSGTHNLAPGTYTSLDIKGSNIINLTGGTYVFTDDIDIKGSSMLKIDASTGPVIIYAMKNVDLGGSSIVNYTQKPSNLILVGGPDTTQVKIRGSQAFYMGIYAPAAHLDISGSEAIYGSFVANDADIDGSAAIHFDQALKNFPLGTGTEVQARW